MERPVIWIISEGSAGHVSQSVGLANALSARLQGTIHQFECRPRINGFVRSMIRRVWMRSAGHPLPDSVLHKWLRLDEVTSSHSPPDLIISSGGKSVFAARTLAVRYGVPYVFLGERKPYPSQWFHTVFTPSEYENNINDVRMDIIPTKVTIEAIRNASMMWKDQPTGRLWAMLIGGTSRSHTFEKQDWMELVDGMVALGQRLGIRWLVSTSPRTGADVEDVLMQRLPPELVADAVWWSRKPDRKLLAYLGAAETVCVTQDSISMITEAIASERPTVVLYPATTQFPARSYLVGYLNRLKDLKWIDRLPISQLKDYQFDPAGFQCVTQPPVDYLVETLLRRLDSQPKPTSRMHCEC